MRVSTNQFYDSSIRAINSQQSALLQVSQQLSAQRKLLSPSDDPVAAGREVALDATLKANEQMLKNQSDAKGCWKAPRTISWKPAMSCNRR